MIFLPLLGDKDVLETGLNRACALVHARKISSRRYRCSVNGGLYRGYEDPSTD